MFHGMGILLMLVVVSTGAVFSVFEPTSPPMIPTTESLIKAAQDVDCDYLLLPPSVLEVSFVIKEIYS